MNKILMSIKPKYVNLILSGDKKYEYRTIKPKEKIDKIIIYATSPVKKVVGEVEVLDILEDTPSNIWNKTYKNSSTSKQFFLNYYKDKNSAIAYKLGKTIVYDIPKDLIYYGISKAPQSYIYIKEKNE